MSIYFNERYFFNSQSQYTSDTTFVFNLINILRPMTYGRTLAADF